MKRGFFRIFLALGLLFPVSGLYGAYFYLSTEKSFSETENVRVKLESQNTGAVKVRLYQVPDPESFIKSRKNLNRVYIESENIRNNPVEYLFNYWNDSRSALRRHLAKRIPDESARAGARDQWGDWFAPKRNNRQYSIGLLRDFRFIREFEKEVGGTSESWSYTTIDFDRLSPGLYLAEVFSEDAIAYTLVHVSRTGMILKKTDSRILVRTVNKTTGSAEPAEVSVFDFDTGKLIQSGKTGANGMLDIRFKKNQSSEMLVYAKTKDDFTFYRVSFYPAPVQERMVYLYTDSPIYKYNQTVHIKGLIRDFKDSEYIVPAEKTATVTVTDPRGGENGIGSVKISDLGTFLADYEVPDFAPTGYYQIRVQIGDKNYQGEFRVENYVKPQFKVSVRPAASVVVAGKKTSFQIKADYYTGKPVAGGRVKYSFYRTPLREDVLEDEKDVFQDPAYASKIEFLETRSGELSPEGVLKGEFDPGKYGSERDYAFIIKAEVEDDAYARAYGQSSVKAVRAEFMVKAEPGKSVYLPGETIRIAVRTLLPDGSPAPKKSLEYSAVLEEGQEVLSSGPVTTDEKGSAWVTFKAKGKGFLRFEVKGKDTIGNNLSDSVYTWIGQDQATFVYSSGDLLVVMDKDSYRVGDKARVLLLSPVMRPEALVTVERDDIYETRIEKFTGNTRVLEIPIIVTYTPNCFLSVTMMQNNQMVESTVKIKVPPADKILNISVDTDKKTYGPREKGQIDITVKDYRGNPVEGEVSVSVVDEALYGLSPDIFPDIRLFFYSYRWNSVTTFNSIALRFYGYSRELREKTAEAYYRRRLWDFDRMARESLPFLAGTKEEASKKSDAEERKDFRDQILWSGQVKTDAEGHARIQVAFPDNLTEWRITAVGLNQNTLVGKATASVRTMLDLSAQFNVPGQMNVGDRLNGFIVLNNQTEEDQKVQLSVSAENGSIALSGSNVTVKAQERKAVPVVITPAEIGVMTLRLLAKSRTKSDSLVQSIEILPVSLERTVAQSRMITAASNTIEWTVPATALKGSARLNFGLTPVENPFGAVALALPFLKTYPYGCIEQTTSSFLPNLIAFQAAKKLKMNLPSGFNDRKAIMQKGLSALYGYQNPDGSWGWWQEGGADAYMTAYVLYALQFVKSTYPESLDRSRFERGIAALEKTLSSGKWPDETLVYGYYVLSLCGKTYPDLLEKLSKNVSSNPYSAALLALTANRSGKKPLALELAVKLEKMAVDDGAKAYWGKEDGSWYGSDIVVTSAAVRALSEIMPKSGVLGKAVNYLLVSRNGNIWNHTRDTAEAVFALSTFASLQPPVPAADLKVDVALDAKSIASLDMSAAHFINGMTISGDAYRDGKKHRLVFGIKSGLYAADCTVTYSDTNLSVEPSVQGIRVERAYYRVVNKKTFEPLTNSVQPGDVVLVELSVTGERGNLEYVIVEDGMPSGFQPVFDVNAFQLSVDLMPKIARREFGKGKARFFMRSAGQVKLYYLMQAIYPGTMRAMPARAFEMYRPAVSGNSASAVFEVLP